MVLIAGGLALACLAADPLEPLKAFSASMKQSKIFEVIISCMGFAAVIKLTGCHTHLIAIFVKLLKKAGPFVIIGAALATMVVNSAIPSAAGTSAAVGTILIPLLIAARVPAPIAAATIMAGLYGGNLNPGHVHPTIVAELAGKTGVDFVFPSYLFCRCRFLCFNRPFLLHEEERALSRDSTRRRSRRVA